MAWRRPLWRSCLWLALLAPLAALAQPAGAPWVHEVSRATRTTADGTSEAVTLPDAHSAGERAGPASPVRATYRTTFELPGAPRRIALCMPMLRAHDRIRINGHVVDERIADPMAPLPRGHQTIRFIEVPEPFVRAGTNTLELEAAGRNGFVVSRLYVGEVAAIRARYERRVLVAVIGPAIVSVVVGSLALCVLILWLRRRDPLYGYFGVGALGWALHSAWSVAPFVLVNPAVQGVFWTALYTFFVGMLVVFCVRFAHLHWPRFERVVLVPAYAGPLVLALAQRTGTFAAVEEAWRLLSLCMVAVGLGAVVRFAWRERNVNGALLLLTGLVSFALGLRDFLLARSGDPHPVYLVPYAGLLFVVLVSWLLVDRFVAATRELAAMNRELEQRVASKSAELLRALADMRLAKESAEAANQAKSRFLAAASHDLRQPTHALGLYTATLASDRLAPDQREVVSRMTSSLAVLEAMFGTLLDVSRIDAGAVAVTPQAFAVPEMLHRVADEFAAPAAAKGLRLSVHVPPPDTAAVAAWSDPMLVERIVRNLVDNAVKYTPRGGVLVSARLRGDGEARAWRLEVWDTGPGIAEADRCRVFEEFYQVGNAERDRARGLGLGLSIVRRLADLLGLPLTLSTVVGRGSRFGLDVPVTPQAPREARLGWRGDPVPAGDVAGLCVAVIDDDAVVRDSTERLLRHWGCEAYTAGDATEWLARWGAVAPRLDVVLADFRLRGDANGVDAIATVRRAAGRDVPGLLVSGESSGERLAALRASGFADIAKPVAPEVLRDWLARARPPVRPPAAPPPADAGTSRVSPAAAEAVER